MALIPDELYKVVKTVHIFDNGILSSSSFLQSLFEVVLASEHYLSGGCMLFLSQQKRIAEDNTQELFKAINNVQGISRQSQQ